MPTLFSSLSTNRPGLLSEVFAVLHDLRCDIADAKAWTHGVRIDALVFVRDQEMGTPIDDVVLVRRAESRLMHVLRDCALGAKMVRADVAAVNMYQRLHQLLNEDGEAESRLADQAEAPLVTAAPCMIRGRG